MGVALVFGARGFLGRRVVEALGAISGIDVVESDVPNTVEARSGESSRLLGLDLAAAPEAEIAAALARIRPSIVVDCAGRTAGSVDELARANVATVERLLMGLLTLAVPPRLIHIGSAAEYGQQPYGVPVHENAAAEPLGAYGISKLRATQLVVGAAGRGEVDGVVLRVFNAVGPGMPAATLAGAALARLRAALAAGSGEIEMGPLGTVRDFVDVRDIAAAVVAACVAPSLPGPIVNVGTGTAHTARDLVEALAERVSYRGRIVEGAAGSERSSDVPWMVADVAVARDALGWSAVHDLDSIADFVAGGAGRPR